MTYEELLDDLKKTVSKAMNPDSKDLLILYGSAACGKTTSDFDFCFVRETPRAGDAARIEQAALNFHHKNGLKVDEEVPYSNKLLYSKKDLVQAVYFGPFEKKDGLPQIDPIEKTPEFLSSPQIKKRLLFNMMTTPSRLLLGDEALFNRYKTVAFETLVDIMFSYEHALPMSQQGLLSRLLTDSRSGRSGEDFLGYKKEKPAVVSYLTEQIDDSFVRLTEKGRLKKQQDGTFLYTPSKEFPHPVIIATQPRIGEKSEKKQHEQE